MPHDDWLFRIVDMIAVAEEILSFTDGKDYAEFSASPMLMKAVLHDFAILGEAASRIPVEVMERYSSIPWHRMRGMRNVLIHEYSSVSTLTVWETIHDDLRPVIAQLHVLLGAEDRG